MKPAAGYTVPEVPMEMNILQVAKATNMTSISIGISPNQTTLTLRLLSSSQCGQRLEVSMSASQGEISVQLQSKLLRVLQLGEFERVGDNRTRKVDVRVVTATNRDLVAACSDGHFREDLYYRLSVFPIQMPPLREHPGDIPALAEHCVRDACKRLGRPVLQLAKEQLDVLKGYAWPGNVRELQNAIERAVILAKDGELAFDIRHREEEAAGTGAETPATTLEDVEQMERRIIVRALEETRWKVYGESGAAARLNIKPSTLAYRIKRMDIKQGESGSQKTGTVSGS